MSQPLPEKYCEQLEQALSYVSQTLHHRLRPLARSGHTGDQYECINAVVYLMSSAASPRYVSKRARLSSFTNWSATLQCTPEQQQHQTPEEMAESGFYWLGDADHVKCFFCDLGLRDWTVGDSPAVEHAKFSPLCFYLKASRGMDWLRQLAVAGSSRQANYPASYLRQDHNELMKLMKHELASTYAMAACGVGFNDTKVLLCIARRFIRQRAKYSLQELVLELQADMDRVMLGSQDDGEELQSSAMLPAEFDLAGVLRVFQV